MPMMQVMPIRHEIIMIRTCKAVFDLPSFSVSPASFLVCVASDADGSPVLLTSAVWSLALLPVPFCEPSVPSPLIFSELSVMGCSNAGPDPDPPE